MTTMCQSLTFLVGCFSRFGRIEVDSMSSFGTKSARYGRTSTATIAIVSTIRVESFGTYCVYHGKQDPEPKQRTIMMLTCFLGVGDLKM